MQRTVGSFGLGILAGLVAAVGYFRAGRQPRDTAEQQLFKYGRPEPPHSAHTYTSHSLLYDHCRKVPLWSSELITAHHISGTANRKRSTFQPDPHVPLQFSSTNEDYKGSGWSRGHMTPAADCKHSQEAMDDSHYLTNILPQDFHNNSGYWNRLEMYCRDLTKKYSTVRVISGPLYLPSQPEGQGGKRYVKYQVIGKNDVAVPTHLFKVILAEKENKLSPSPTVTLGVFVIPNEPLGNVDLSQFQTTLHGLETLSGISFHPELDTSQVGDLCTTDTCKLMTPLELRQFIYKKRLRSAKSGHQLKEILAEAERRGMGGDPVIIQAADQRRAELNTQPTVSLDNQ